MTFLFSFSCNYSQLWTAVQHRSCDEQKNTQRGLNAMMYKEQSSHMWNLSQIYIDILHWKDFPVELYMWQKAFESEQGMESQRPVLIWQDCKNAEKYERPTLLVKKKNIQKWTTK